MARSGPPIVTSAVRLERGADEWTLSCKVDAPGLGVPERFFYTVQRPPANGAELSACPFVPPLVLLAAYNSRDLIIEAPVSQVLLDHVRGVLALWHQSDRNATLIDVTAVPVALTRRASAAASFFSGGVDSFYSVLATDSRYGSSDPRFIRFLIFCHGFDIPLDDLRREADVRAHLERAAGDLGKELVTVRTNARDFVKRIGWTRHGYGPCLGGVGLALSPITDTVYRPASYAYHQFPPGGSNAAHPFFDSLWSTETLDIVHSGAEATRAEKIACLSRSSAALAHLRVCWQNVGKAYNCCRCEKCLRTMADLELCGVLDGMEAFPLPLTPDVLRSVRIQPHLLGFWQEWLEHARQANIDLALCDTVAELVSRERFEQSSAGRAMRMFVRRPLSGIGFTPSRLREIDVALLEGRGLRTFQKMRHWLRS
jgi:hypothetical protein